MTHFSCFKPNWSAAALAFGLIVLMPRDAEGDDPQKKATLPSRSVTDLDRFRALEPAERLKLVEKLPAANTLFAATKRGHLVAAVVERGVIEPADYADVFCRVKTSGKGGAATTIDWVIDDGSAVKKGDLLA